MQQQLGQLVLLVNDYDEAIAFFTNRLGFTLIEDTPLGDKRWVVVQPEGGGGASLLLAKAKNDEQRSRVGNQTGGRVAFFLYTDDFWRDYEAMQANDIEFIAQPREESYGTVVVFKDLYGNKWDFIQQNEKRV